MNRDNPTLRWLAWPVCFAVVGPLLYWGMFHSLFGIAPRLLSSQTVNHWPWLLLLCCYPLPVWAVLRWKQLGMGVALSAALLFVQATCANHLPDSARVILVNFGEGPGQSGVDVICNGVHLGVTPFTMTNSEFTARVQPWTTPPDQPVVSYSADDNGLPIFEDDTSMMWTWTAGNPFRNPFPRSGGGETEFQIHHDQQKLRTYLKTAPYWWRFERDGCRILRPMWSMSGGASGGTSIVVHASIASEVQSARAMHDLVLASLRSLDYQPSSDWINFVLKYRKELLTELIKDAAADDRLAQVMDRMADDHFGLLADADLQASRAALNRVFESVSRIELESFDGFAFRTALRIARQFPQLLIERTTQEASSTPDLWILDHSYPVRKRKELLFRLLADVHPPELFDLLTFLHGIQHRFGIWNPDSKLLIAIANSGRSEAIPILRQYFDDAWNKTNPMFGGKLIHEQGRQASLRVMADIAVPELESLFWQIINDKIQPDVFNQQTPLPEFIRTRIARSQDRRSTAHQIAFCKALTDSEKGFYLAQINEPEAGVLLRSIADRLGDSERHRLMDEICQLPANPACAEFLVQTWKRARKVQTGMIRSEWNRAILKTDSPVIEEFLVEQLSADNATNASQEWSNIAAISEPLVPRSLAHLDWLVPVLKTVSPRQRYGSLSLLLAIGTEDAVALLHDWAIVSEGGLGGQVKWLLNRHEELARIDEAKKSEVLAKANELLSGRLAPDGLLPLFPSARWTGETYEPIPVKNVKK